MVDAITQALVIKETCTGESKREKTKKMRKKNKKEEEEEETTGALARERERSDHVAIAAFSC